MSGIRLNKRALGKVVFYQVPFDIRKCSIYAWLQLFLRTIATKKSHFAY